MPSSQSSLPEGTDSIVTGASDATIDRSGDYAGAPSFGTAPSSAGTSTGGATGSTIEQAGGKLTEATAGLRAQAADKARDYAAQGKERAVGALDNVQRLVDDAASTIDEKVGEQYGAYARQASQAVAQLADTLRDKDVDELVDDARELIRKSPAIAIGAAAAIGFVIARLVKAGVPATDTADAADDTLGTAYGTPTSPRTPSTAATVPVDVTA